VSGIFHTGGSRAVEQQAAAVADACAGRQDQSQIAHRQIARAEVADEGEPVSELELANRDHITLEPCCSSGCQSRVDRASSDVAGGYLRSRCRRAVEVQVARAGLRTSAERIGRGIRDRETGVKSALIGYERIQQNGITQRYREYVLSR